MSYDDEILMELIEEDLMSVSEFGDRYYYEGLRELEKEEEERGMRIQASSMARRNRNRRGHDEILPLPEPTPSSSERSHQQAIEMMRKNHSEMYRNEYLEKMYEDSKKRKNVEKSIAPVTKDEPVKEPVEEKNEDPKTVKAKTIEPEILKEMTAIKKRERRNKNAMLIALKGKKKTPLEEYRDPKSPDSSSADLEPVNRYSIDANETKKTVVKALPETTHESIDVTDRFAALFLGKDVEAEYCDAKSSESSSATYYSAHSDLSEVGDGDIPVTGVKHKKKTHTTSQRRQNRTVISLASASNAPPKPFVYVSPKEHSSINLSSKSDFPQL